jgi:hypothetical protein
MFGGWLIDDATDTRGISGRAVAAAVAVAVAAAVTITAAAAAVAVAVTLGGAT